MESQDRDEIHNCVIKLRVNPQKRREKVYIGCGAGFGGDRPMAALKLLQRVKELNYLVLECLAERTLAERYQFMVSGGDGYDSWISHWMRLLLPLAMERRTCLITNMGAMDPCGAQEKVREIASSLGLSVSIAVAHETFVTESGSPSSLEKSYLMGGVRFLSCMFSSLVFDVQIKKKKTCILLFIFLFFKLLLLHVSHIQCSQRPSRHSPRLLPSRQPPEHLKQTVRHLRQESQ
ncbi:uncharacterized protein LOC115962093 isoform X1 [Quercus lobata]|uniref:uncharacterized protein LOC115962093 isoform X1 n=1 Tax=Quercus lobata TaxID=97700 RepID=UPI001247F63A|nr:uncharacterized protein LOC115962093 isoform X1 [Quercus lobata]